MSHVYTIETELGPFVVTLESATEGRVVSGCDYEFLVGSKAAPFIVNGVPYRVDARWEKKMKSYERGEEIDPPIPAVYLKHGYRPIQRADRESYESDPTPKANAKISDTVTAAILALISQEGMEVHGEIARIEGEISSLLYKAEKKRRDAARLIAEAELAEVEIEALRAELGPLSSKLG